MLKTLLHCVQLHLNQLNLLHLYIISTFLRFTTVEFGYAHVHFLLTIVHFPCFSPLLASARLVIESARMSGLFLSLELSDADSHFATSAAPGPTIEST